MALSRLSEKLYTSISQVKCWLLCPRKYQLKYVEGLVPEFQPVALVFGSAFHSALATYYGLLEEKGMPPPVEEMIGVFREKWQEGSTGTIPLQQMEDDEDPGAQVDKGVAMLRAFHQHARAAPQSRVDGVEKSFEVRLSDPDTGQIQEELLVGTFDLVVTERTGRVIVEHKTSARKYGADQLAFDLQPTAYRYAARMAGLGDCSLRFQVVTKTKTPAVQVEDLTRSSQDEDDMLRTTIGVLRAIDNGVFYPTKGWACRTCQFQKACASKSAGRATSRPVTVGQPQLLILPGGAA